MIRPVLLIIAALGFSAEPSFAGGYCGSMPSYLYCRHDGYDDCSSEVRWCDYYRQRDAAARAAAPRQASKPRKAPSPISQSSHRPGSAAKANPPSPSPSPRRNLSSTPKADSPDGSAAGPVARKGLVKASPKGGACQAEGQKQASLKNFEEGIKSINADAASLREAATKVEALVLRLRAVVPGCAPLFGGKVVDAIDSRGSDGRSLVQKIRMIGQEGKGAGRSMATALESAKGKYQALDFCSVDSCAGAFGALNDLFNPVSIQAKASLKKLAELRDGYITPAKAVMEAKSQDIEFVLSDPACNGARAAYRNALRHWRTVQAKVGALENKISKESQVTGALAKGSGRAPSCTVAGGK